MFATTVLDKSSPVPLYAQLAGRLERLISEGTYPVGSKLPPEESLARQYELNRNTVRHALALLVHRGVVRTEKGVGTFVRRTRVLAPVHRLDRMTSFVDDFDLDRAEVEDAILAKGRFRATADLASKLNVEPASLLVRIERLRLADHTPFVFERQYYDHGLFGRLLDIDIQGSMYQLLIREFQADLHHSVQTLRAVRAPRHIARRLRLRADTPCMFLESIAYTAHHRPLELLQAYYRGDRYTFRVESGRYRHEAQPLEAYA
ncbi:MAG TPA: GntR family transcriptional regulator [Anaerolineales bacterium]|nr:GntR family transcriptional regulator [Anaerolineales bacterium]